MSVTMSQHISRTTAKFTLSDESVYLHDSEKFRYLEIEDGDGGRFTLFLTTQQAEELAVTILAKLKADRQQDQRVA